MGRRCLVNKEVNDVLAVSCAFAWMYGNGQTTGFRFECRSSYDDSNMKSIRSRNLEA